MPALREPRTATYSPDVIVERSMDSGWLSNAYLVYDKPGGKAVFVESGAPLGLLLDMRAYPGHTDETTIGREWEQNPFVRVWRGVEPEGSEPCRVGGEDATLIVWSPDYDGKGKAWVRFAGGRDAIVGGSRVER